MVHPDPKAWLVAVAWRRFPDDARAEPSRRGRELAVKAERPAGPAPATDDTLRLCFLCAHPTPPRTSAVVAICTPARAEAASAKSA